MRPAALSLAWISAAVAVAGFYQPWAFFEVREPEMAQPLRSSAPFGRLVLKIQRGTETVTSELPALSDLPRQVSGAEIPRMVHEERAQTAMAVLELLTKTRQHLAAKSDLVYAVPGLALACAIILTTVGAPLAVGVVCAVIAGIGFWKLAIMPKDSSLIAITVGQGLWMSVAAYIGLAVAAAVAAVAALIDTPPPTDL